MTKKKKRAAKKPDELQGGADVVDRFEFTDKAGNSWDVSLDLAGARRIDNSDFSSLTDEEFSIVKPDKRTFMLILDNSSLLFAMIWAVVQPQVKEKLGVDPEEDLEKAEAAFLTNMNGRAIEEGREAFWQAIADFFPEHRTVLLNLMRQFGRAHQRVAEKIGELESHMSKMVDLEVDKGMAKLKEEMEKELQGSTPET